MESPWDLSGLRAQFPALERTGPDGRPLVHTDAPGGTQVPQQVIDAMVAHLRTASANAGQDFVTSTETDRMVAQVRTRLAALLGGTASGIVFGPNMTTLTWHLARALDAEVADGDEIVCTRLDHDANVAPWLALAERRGATVRWVGVDGDGRLRTDHLDAVVTHRTRLIAFPLASNVLGTVVDPTPFVAAARSVGAWTFADAVHAVPHQPVHQRGDGVDWLVCSPYKFFGPHAGTLSADPTLLATVTPDRVRAQPDVGPGRWQLGTANFEAIAGVGAAVDHVAGLGLDAIGAHEGALTARFLDGLAGLPRVRLHGPPEPSGRTPTFALTVDGYDPPAVQAHLAERGILTFVGHCYAVEPLAALGLLETGGIVRVGFVHYHGLHDVDRVLDALAELTAR